MSKFVVDLHANIWLNCPFCRISGCNILPIYNESLAQTHITNIPREINEERFAFAAHI